VLGEDVVVQQGLAAGDGVGLQALGAEPLQHLQVNDADSPAIDDKTGLKLIGVGLQALGAEPLQHLQWVANAVAKLRARRTKK